MVYSSYKKIDEVGRIVLSKDIRKALDIQINDVLKIDVEGNRIVIEKAEPSCIFCGAKSQLQSHMGKAVCKKCIKNLNNP